MMNVCRCGADTTGQLAFGHCYCGQHIGARTRREWEKLVKAPCSHCGKRGLMFNLRCTACGWVSHERDFVRVTLLGTPRRRGKGVCLKCEPLRLSPKLTHERSCPRCKFSKLLSDRDGPYCPSCGWHDYRRWIPANALDDGLRELTEKRR